MTDEEKFKVFAQKVDTPEKCVELCRKYLEKKGDVSHAPKTVYIGGTDIVTVNARCNIPMEEFVINSPGQAEAHARKQITHHLIDQILQSGDLVKFRSARDVFSNQMIYHGTINVWRGDKK